RLNRNYVIDVASPRRVPEGADVPEELVAEHRLPDEAPVIYALDGGLGVMAASAYLLGFNFVMQPAYVVSIDYPEEWGREQWTARSHDLLHERVSRNGEAFGGGGADFEAF